MKILHRVFCIMTVSLVFPILLTSLVHGPGRGMSFIPSGMWWTGPMWLVEVVTFSCLLIGAVRFRKAPSSSLVFLGVGMIGRMVYELRISVLKAFVISGSGFLSSGFALGILACYYLGGFLFPSLLLIDAIRAWKSGRKVSEVSE